MDKKYVLHSGHVISITDGERHYINSNELLHLYQLNRRECWFENLREHSYANDVIHLYPRAKGDYIEHKEALEEYEENLKLENMCCLHCGNEIIGIPTFYVFCSEYCKYKYKSS